LLRVVKYESSEKITKTSPVVTTHRLASSPWGLLMCNYCQRTVRLHKSGRTFCCAYCIRVREHPYFDYLYVRDHHAYCDFCGRWMEIENKTTSETEEENNTAREKKPAIT